MSKFLKQSFSSIQRSIFPKDIPWRETKLEHDSLAIARITHFDCGGKALSLCLCHKLGDTNTLCNFLLHWSALARGHSFPAPRLNGASILPPDPLNQFMFELKNQPHIARTFRFDVSKIDGLMALVSSQSNIKNITKAEIVTAFMNSSLVRVQKKKNMTIAGSSSSSSSVVPFTIYIPLNIRKLISPELTNLMGNFLSFLLVRINDEDDLKLPTLVSKIRKEKIRQFKKFKRLHKDDIPSTIRLETERLKADNSDFRMSTSVCDYPLYDIDFGWGKPSKVSFGALPTRNFFGMFDAPDNGGVEVIASLDEQIMEEFQRDEQILRYATLDWGL